MNINIKAFIHERFDILPSDRWVALYYYSRLKEEQEVRMKELQPSLQTFSAWIALPPFPKPQPAQLQNLYLFATIAYLIIIWRLWPKEEDDYRV